MRFILDDKTVCVFGFSTAGWQDLRLMFEKEGKRVITTTESILSPEESIYQKHHPLSILCKKATHPKKNQNSVEAALKTLASFFLAIEHTETRTAILRYFVERIKNCDEAFFSSTMDALEKISGNAEKNQYLLEVLCTLNASSIDTMYDDANLTGYNLASIFRTTDLLITCLKGSDLNLRSALETWSNHANLLTSKEQIQVGLAQSKGLIVDILQINLTRLNNHQPLLPIYFITTSEFDKFSPNWLQATQKTALFYTLTEARMLYKLIIELNDPLITSLLEETVFFMKKISRDSFSKISPPWITETVLWKTRVRSKNKPPYSERREEDIPLWIRELREISRNTALTPMASTPKNTR